MVTRKLLKHLNCGRSCVTGAKYPLLKYTHGSAEYDSQIASYFELSVKRDVGGRALAFHNAVKATNSTATFFTIYEKRNSPTPSSRTWNRKLTPSTNRGTRLYRYLCSCTGERMATRRKAGTAGVMIRRESKHIFLQDNF